MSASPTQDLMAPDRSSPWFEHAASPVATVEGADHLVRDVNAAFCRLIGVPRSALLGRSFCELIPHSITCLSSLDDVYRTGRPATVDDPERPGSGPVASSYGMWPIKVGDRTIGIVIQVNETTPLLDQTRAMNEALLLGSLRQHELAAAAAAANLQLVTEVGQRLQSEQDALMLTREISHRIKNNLQAFVALIANEIRRTPAEFAQGFIDMETRVAAIASLYDLISSGAGQMVRVDQYLQQIADALTASLLEPQSGIRIEVDADALEIDAERAAPFGLMVNELGTNAVKHAFPGGSGRVILSARRVGDQMEFTVADNGVGRPPNAASTRPGTHGSDYVAIFVRQLGGVMAVSPAQGGGTLVRVWIPPLFAKG